LAKILLVEDDFALRDIYSARLAAEGHTVVTASDGEEALAVAMREHPDLILLDVMMPKISGPGHCCVGRPGSSRQSGDPGCISAGGSSGPTRHHRSASPGHRGRSRNASGHATV
jgi:hypothetical protein